MQRELEARLAALEVQRLEDAGQRQKIEYEIAQAQLARRTISAPFDGVLVKLFVYLGDACTPPAPVARIVDVSKCRLVTHVDAGASAGLRGGHERQDLGPRSAAILFPRRRGLCFARRGSLERAAGDQGPFRQSGR